MNNYRIIRLALLGSLLFALGACGTPASEFGVYRQSDGTIGVHAPKDAKESEAQAAALEECKKDGKRFVSILEQRKTVNSNFPTTYLYSCR
jgi:hypothetical protein